MVGLHFHVVGKHFDDPPPPNPVGKTYLTPPDIWQKCLWPPPHTHTHTPQPSPQNTTVVFLAALNHNEGSKKIARYHTPKLYSDILSITKWFSISAVEWGDKLTKTTMMQIPPQINGYFCAPSHETWLYFKGVWVLWPQEPKDVWCWRSWNHHKHCRKEQT